MQKYQDVAMVSAGGTMQPLAGASVAVVAAGTTTASTLYSDNSGTALANPFTTGTDGRFAFYATNGRYTITITKAGFSTTTITDVSLYDRFDTVGTNVIASATALVLATDRDVMQVSGTTTITSISTATKGRVITLVFQDALTFTDGSNLKLAGNFSTSADDCITLVCADGINWTEVARSAN